MRSAPQAMTSGTGRPTAPSIRTLVQEGALHCVFQPLLSLADGSVFGFEGLLRGPGRNGQQSPIALFETATREGCVEELEIAARRLIAERYVGLGLEGKLFVNFSPYLLANQTLRSSRLDPPAGLEGIPPQNVVIELTEGSQATDFDRLVQVLDRYRSQGYHIAIDDLGEGFASLKLWSKVRPEMVKVDRHFINEISSDGLKLRFVQAIQHIAESSGAAIVAEGVETEAELRVLRDLGIPYVQGFLTARPAAKPAVRLSSAVQQMLSSQTISVYPESVTSYRRSPAASKLLRHIVPVEAQARNDSVFARFEANPELESLPVVRSNRPLGLINRHEFFDRFARPYQRELFGRKPCTTFMDDAPLIVPATLPIQELSLALARGERRHLSDGFILTDPAGLYLGMGTGHDLMREITQLQITAARYANPLTLLPGNVPISEHMDRLVAARAPFVVGHADLDHFKPLNDALGYRKGDEVIQLLGRTLGEWVDSECDFLGHVGGDDFMLLMQSSDWESRLRSALAGFQRHVPDLLDETTRARGGFEAEDRRGERHFYPLPSLSIGAVVIPAAVGLSATEISALAAEAKRQAKRLGGNSLFVERRRLTG